MFGWVSPPEHTLFPFVAALVVSRTELGATTVFEILLDTGALDILNEAGGIAALCVLKYLQDRCTHSLCTGRR